MRFPIFCWRIGRRGLPAIIHTASSTRCSNGSHAALVPFGVLSGSEGPLASCSPPQRQIALQPAGCQLWNPGCAAAGHEYFAYCSTLAVYVYRLDTFLIEKVLAGERFFNQKRPRRCRIPPQPPPHPSRAALSMA